MFFLPSSVRIYSDRIAAAVEKWPIDVSVDRALKWVLQFDAVDYPLAIRVIENLDVFGTAEIRASLEVANTKLLRTIAEKGAPVKGGNTLYAGIGSAAKSGAMISYHYRVMADISEEDFFSSEEEQELDLSKIENIVLVDDVIGTGKTVASEVKRIAEEVYVLAKARNIFVLTVAGYEDGIQHVIAESGAAVVTALEYSTKDTVANLDAEFYAGLSVADRAVAFERLKRYCRVISKSDLGFGGLGGLLVFDHNTPNTTLPIVWHTGKGWVPLFRRATKIPGTSKVLRSAEREREKESITPPTEEQSAREGDTVTLFVEGKVDELFVDYLRQSRELAEKLGVKQVLPVALGGLYQSKRLLELLRSTKKNAIFVLEDDPPARQVSARLGLFNNVEVVYLKPFFVAMLDFEKIYSHRERFPGLPDQMASTKDFKWLEQVEMAVLKRKSVTANPERLFQMLDEYLDPVKYEAFVADLRQAINSLSRRAAEAK